MPLNNNLILAATKGIDLTTPAQLYQQGQQQKFRNRLLEADQDMKQQESNALQQRREAESVIDGSIQLKSFLDAGDQEGAKKYLESRIASIRARDGDPRHSMAAYNDLISGNVEGLNNSLNSILTSAQQRGLIKGQQQSPNLNSLYQSLPEENRQAFQGFSQADPTGKSAINYAESVLKPSKSLVTINNADQKGMTKEQEKLAETRVNRFDQLKTDANSAISQNEQLSQLSQMDLSTGFGEGAKTNIARVFNSFGVDGDSLLGVDAANAQAFNAVTGKLLGEALAAQKGPQTDRDADRMMKTLPQLTNEQDSNTFIIESMMAINDRKVEQADFYERILEEDGSLKNADQRWREYKQKTPLVSDSVINRETGLPMFFNQFQRMAKDRNPNATRQQIINAWRQLNE